MKMEHESGDGMRILNFTATLTSSHETTSGVEGNGEGEQKNMRTL